MTQHPSRPPARPRSPALPSLSPLVLACLLALVLPVNAPAAGKAAAKAPARESSAPVTLNFVNADIEAVTRAISSMINRPMLVDPRVKGTITLYSERPVTMREGYQNYLAGLRGLPAGALGHWLAAAGAHAPAIGGIHQRAQ